MEPPPAVAVAPAAADSAAAPQEAESEAAAATTTTTKPSPAASDAIATAAAAAAAATAAEGGGGGVPAARLNHYFVCPQCQGYFRDPHVATCCLSTFCRDCIVRVLRTPTSACPGCGKYMGVVLPQRTRPDPQLQAVMLKLLPDIFERERAREAIFWRDRAAQGEEHALHPNPPRDRTHSGSTTSSAFAAATAKWLPPEERAAPTPVPAPPPQGGPSSVPAPVYHHDPTTPLHQDMFVLCTPQPPEGGQQSTTRERLPALPLPYLKLQRRTQVGQLQQIVAAALGLGQEEDPEALEIVCRGQALMAQHSLHFVDRTTWRNEAPPLHLHYRRRRAQRRGR